MTDGEVIRDYSVLYPLLSDAERAFDAWWRERIKNPDKHRIEADVADAEECFLAGWQAKQESGTMSESDYRHATRDTQCALPDGHSGLCQTYVPCVICGHYNTQHFEYPHLLDTRCFAADCTCQGFRSRL